MGNRSGSRIEVGWGQRRHGVRWGGPGVYVAAAAGADVRTVNASGDVRTINASGDRRIRG